MNRGSRLRTQKSSARFLRVALSSDMKSQDGAGDERGTVRKGCWEPATCWPHALPLPFSLASTSRGEEGRREAGAFS